MKLYDSWSIFEQQGSVNEMAKMWPVGAIVKGNDILDTSERSYSKWHSWRPGQLKDAKGGCFYMEVTESGRSWLVGRILFANCIYSDVPSPSFRYRIRTSLVESPTSEFKILAKESENIKKVMNKQFFFDGDEGTCMNIEGESAKTVESGEYRVLSVNFKLTDLFDEPVMMLMKMNNKAIFVKLSDLEKSTKELDQEQKESVVEWFNKKLGIQISIYSSALFQITTFKLKCYTESPYPSNFEAGPFVTKEQAEKVMKLLKEEDVILFKPGAVKVEAGDPKNLSLTSLVDFVKANGVEVNMKELLDLKRGTSAGKKFGL